LAERFRVGRETIDLTPLLRSLTNSALIASVDGKRLPDFSKPTSTSTWRYFLRFYFCPRLLRIAYHKLPTVIGRKLAYCAWFLDARAALWPQALRAAARFESCPDHQLPLSKHRHFAKRYFRHLLLNFVDFESVAAMTPARGEAWFRTHVDYEGLEHLARLKDEGVPIIVAGFHFSTVKLMALLLTRHGYDINQVWLSDRSIEGGSGRWLDEFRNLSPGFGRFESISGFTLDHYRLLIESVRKGEVLVWFSDMFPSRDAVDREKVAGHDQASKTFRIPEFRTDLPQSRIEIELFGRRVYQTAWIGAFARLTGAAVVPAALIRDRGRLKMILKPALRLPQPGGPKQAAELNRALFRELESLLRLYPDQWCGWPTLSVAA
jgi:lauroyl/myristoyl acyltransferase